LWVSAEIVNRWSLPLLKDTLAAIGVASTALFS